MWHRIAFLSNRQLWRIWNRVDIALSLTLAAILLVAAGAKAFRGDSLPAVPVPVEIIVFLEVGVALVVVFHRTAIALRLLAAAFFALLAVISGTAVAMQRPCNCLGEIDVPPTWLVGVDALAAFWLATGSVMIALLYRSKQFIPMCTVGSSSE